MSGGVTLYGPWGFCGPDVTDAAMRVLTALIENLIATGATAVALEAETAARVAGDVALATDPLRPTIADGAIVAVEGMAAGPGFDALALCVLGRLGDDLYLIGSQNDPAGQAGAGAGALSGVWRHRHGVWAYLGNAPRETGAVHNYNHTAEHGAVAYDGQLYVGDRHLGRLYRLELNYDGSLSGIPVVGQVGNEDVFPAPPFAGLLPLGTFGAIGMPDDMPGLFTWDGTTVVNRAFFDDCGNQGWVDSMVAHGGYLWCHVRNAAGTYFELWRFDTSWAGVLVWSGDQDHRLLSIGTSLVAIEWRDTAPQVDAHWVAWRDDDWETVSAGIGAVSVPAGNGPNMKAVWSVGDRLYAASYYHGVFCLDRKVITKISAAPPRAQGVAAHAGATWIMGVNPVQLYQLAPATFSTPPPPATVTAEPPPAMAALPLATASLRGHVVLLLGDGVATADALYECRRNAAGIYEWAPLGTGTPVIPLPTDPAFLYDGASLVGADGTAIASWADLSAAAVPVTQATGASQPTMRTVSGIRVARFDGVNDQLRHTTGAHVQPMTTALVVKLNSTAAIGYLCDSGSGLNGHVLYGGAGPWGMVSAVGGPTGPASDTAWHIIVGTFVGGAFRLRVGGGAGTGSAIAGTGRTGITLGGGATGVQPASMDLAEALSWDRALTLDELNALGTHLAARFAALGVTWATAT